MLVYFPKIIRADDVSADDDVENKMQFKIKWITLTRGTVMWGFDFLSYIGLKKLLNKKVELPEI